MKTNKITIKAPEECLSCIFNYDGIECRIFKDKYKEDYLNKFDPFNGQRPKWCSWELVTITLESNNEN